MAFTRPCRAHRVNSRCFLARRFGGGGHRFSSWKALFRSYTGSMSRSAEVHILERVPHLLQDAHQLLSVSEVDVRRLDGADSQSLGRLSGARLCAVAFDGKVLGIVTSDWQTDSQRTVLVAALKGTALEELVRFDLAGAIDVVLAGSRYYVVVKETRKSFVVHKFESESHRFAGSFRVPSGPRLRAAGPFLTASCGSLRAIALPPRSPSLPFLPTAFGRFLTATEKPTAWLSG